jgi:hypothetical protein
VDLTDPTGTALLCAEAFERAGLRYALCGGLALAAYGEPRETRDVDLAVLQVSARAAQEALKRSGIEGVVAFDDVAFGGLSLGRVTLLGGKDTLGFNTLDLVRPRSQRYAGAVLERALRSTLRKQPITVVAPEDFVLLKLLDSRDRDLEDAGTVLVRSRDVLDLALIEREVGALAAEIADWDVRSRWATARSSTSST